MQGSLMTGDLADKFSLLCGIKVHLYVLRYAGIEASVNRFLPEITVSGVSRPCLIEFHAGSLNCPIENKFSKCVNADRLSGIY